MSNHAWVTGADVLKDLEEVNGRNMGAAHLEQFVVRGEMPPPARQELDDDEDMQYHFGADAAAGEANHTPDLQGISLMLKMVDDLDDSSCAEPKTIFRNTVTDEISISKLNPNVNEFVPCGGKTSKPELKSEVSQQVHLKTKPKFAINLPVLIQKRDKMNLSEQSSQQNGHSSTGKQSDEKTVHLNDHDHAENSDNITLDSLKKNDTSTTSNTPSGKMDKETSRSDFTSTPSKTSLATGEISLDKKLDITRMKSDEIAVMKEKVKSKIINPSHDNVMQRKREKNVAIATLLKLCTAPPVPSVAEPVKLVTPQYFQGPPMPDEVDTKIETVKDIDVSLVNEKIEQIPDTSTNAKVDQKYVDPFVEESISKVNDWFNNTGSPKPQPPAAPPVLVKPVAFKKKATSTQSVSSTTKSEASSQKKRSCGNFVPSAYANDLLQKYEKNAKTMVVPKEDLGTMLERQLKERDQQIKKLLEKKNAASPNSGRSVQ